MNYELLTSVTRPHRLARPRTPPFHGGDTSSNLVGDAFLYQRLAKIRYNRLAEPTCETPHCLIYHIDKKEICVIL